MYLSLFLIKANFEKQVQGAKVASGAKVDVHFYGLVCFAEFSIF